MWSNPDTPQGVLRAMKRTSNAVPVLAVVALAALGMGLGLWTPHPALRATEAAVQKKTDKDHIVGTWKLTAGRERGKDFPAEVTSLARVEFTKDGNVVLRIVEDVKEGKYKLPKAGQIDMAMGGPDYNAGIYKFDGMDRLT